jgi:hypothetical protein
MSETKYDNIGFRTAVETVEQAFEQIYGVDRVVVSEVLGNKKVKAKGVSDEVVIMSEEGSTILNFDSAQIDTAKQVKEHVDNKSTGGGSGGNGSDSFSVRGPDEGGVPTIDKESVEVERESETVTNTVRPQGSSGTITKPYNHQEAGYTEPGDQEYDSTHGKCSDCAFYDNAGNCRIVENIEPDGYCEQFYSDIVLAAREHPDDVEINLVAWGENADLDRSDLEKLADKISSLER